MRWARENARASRAARVGAVVPGGAGGCRDRASGRLGSGFDRCYGVWCSGGSLRRFGQAVQAAQDMFQPLMPLPGSMTLSGEWTTSTTSPISEWL
ncbi:hypothetical protein SAMN05216259_10585 [Actinacidiphila guanduensis]|uniref:Uncharacterized protein n=1 Tax=Actinacidiphila guanduensis TaxID=310781 RepID=A0A1H0D689_9ACTN|nr:hypothetical protein SAMN05216259_10585 [Actinacidiphila guanduensis]